MLHLVISFVALVVCCGLQLISIQVGVVAGGTALLASFLSRWLFSENTTGPLKEWEGPLINLYRSAEEHPEPMEGTLLGSIPDWLCGRFFRCGPAKYEVGDTRFNHWFDGLAMLMCFNIRNGKATFQSKFLRSRVYQKCMAANRIVVSGMGTASHPDPCKTIFQRVMSHFKQLNPNSGYDNTWVTAYPMGEDLIVATETDVIYSFDPVTLDIKDRIRHSKYIAVNGASAHAHYDPDGTVYNMGGSFKGRPQYNIIKIPPADKTSGDNSPLSRGKVVCSIPARHKTRPAYFHSFAMTDNYYVFVEMPYYFNMVTVMWNLSRGKPLVDAMKFYPDEKTWFYIVRREDGEILKTQYITNGFTFFHVINAYEDKDSVVLDLCGYDSADYTAVLMERVVQGNKEDLSSVRRFVLPLQESKMQTGENLVQLEYTTATAVTQQDGSIYCTHETLTNGMDLPQINYSKYRGKKYRYTYGICNFNFVGGEKLVKLDVTTKTKLLWSEKDCFPSEPVFVAAPDAEEEDEGVLVSAVISSDAEKAPFLLVMDAATMKEMGRVVFDKVAFPRGAHGLFTNIN